MLLDVDGVLTDNSIYLGDDGKEIKKFNVSDGLGIYFAQKAGIKVAFLSGRTSKSARIRGKELKVKELHFGINDKMKVYERLKRKLKLEDKEILYLGDDLLDYEIFKKTGVPIGVKNGDKRINRLALYVTKKKGGEGAVREVVDLILESRKIKPVRFFKMIIEKAKEVIRKEANAILNLEKKINSEFQKAVEIILKCRGRVIVTGIGKSGIIGKKIAATLTSTGTAAIFLHPVEGLHGDLGLVRRDDVVIAITKSGATEELQQLFPLFKRLGVPIISLTGDPGSPAAEKSDVVLDVSVDEEACPNNLVPTSSTTAALVMGDALAITLLEERHFSTEFFPKLSNTFKEILL